MRQLLRFFAVTVLGVILDLAIAFALHQWAGVPLWLAAATGFGIAAGANYVTHQTWSFRTGPLSARRAALYGATALVTLAVRIGTVAALDRLLPGAWPLAILVAGAGASFGVNFALSKWVVFAPATAGDTP
jgi:putative flippase GtrA